MESRIIVDPDVVLVEVDGTTVAYVPSCRELLELHTDAARLVAAIEAGDSSQLPDDALALADDLLAHGILRADDRPDDA